MPLNLARPPTMLADPGCRAPWITRRSVRRLPGITASLTAGHGLPQSVHPAMDHHLGLTYSSWNEFLVGLVRDVRTAGQRPILNGAPDRRTEAVRGRQVGVRGYRTNRPRVAS